MFGDFYPTIRISPLVSLNILNRKIVFAHSILPRVYKEKLIRFCPLPTNILLMQPA
jgi:hypothetical protein